MGWPFDAFFFLYIIFLYLTYSIISFPGKHLVSVGVYIYLWDFRSGEMVTKVQATSSCSSITSVAFSLDAKVIVTAGTRHLKFWTLGSCRRTQLNGGRDRTTSLAIHGKPANLAIQRRSSFKSIASSVWSNNFKQEGDNFPIYALTDAGSIWFITPSKLTCVVLLTFKDYYVLQKI